MACDGAIRAATRQSPPRVLYHFTDAAGLIGIVKEKAMWASLATSLNDSSEIQFGIDLAMEVLGESKKRSNGIGEAFFDWIARFISKPHPTVLEARSFVVSFCENHDRSGQWLHYGRQGEGLALGLTSEKLHSPGYELTCVLYDEGRQRQAILGLLEAALSALVRGLALVPENKALAIARCAAATATNFWLLAPSLKKSAFREEAEWRLVTYEMWLKNAIVNVPGVSLGEVYYRAQGGRVVPYQRAEFPSGVPLLKIVLGANSAMKREDHGLRVFLSKSVADRGAEVEVEVSDVPVRR